MSNTDIAAWVPASVAPVARHLAACCAPTGHGMWRTETSSTPAGAVEGYISSGPVDTAFAALMLSPDGETPEQLQQRAAACLAAAEAGAAQQGIVVEASLQDAVDVLTAARSAVGDPYVLLDAIGQLLREPDSE
jgi:hypothetical protein